MPSRILFVSTKVAPYASRDSASELSRELPRALRERGHELMVVAPLYDHVVPADHGFARRLDKLPLAVGGEQLELELHEGTLADSDAKVWLIAPDGAPFAGEDFCNSEAPRAHRRAMVLSAGAIALAAKYGFPPDAIHVEGALLGFVPYLLRNTETPLAAEKVLFSLHDGADAAVFPPAILDELRLGYDRFTPEGIEFFGEVSLLKAGAVYADAVVVHSRGYAQHLLTEEGSGRLHGFYSSCGDKLCGVLGGLDQTAWNPRRDRHLAGRFDLDAVDGKASCKRALQQAAGLPLRAETPLVVAPAPFEDGLLLKAAEELQQDRVQLLFAGEASGTAGDALAALVASSPERVAHLRRLDDPALHQLLAGGDLLVAPLRVDPAGRLLLKALRYGAVPLTYPAGAAVDAMVEFDMISRTGTGFFVRERHEQAVLSTLRRALAIYQNADRWSALRRNAMAQDNSWSRAISCYEHLYGLRETAHSR